MSMTAAAIRRTEIIITDGRIIVWQRIVLLMQSRTKIPGIKAESKETGIKATESPIFALESEMKKCAREIARSAREKANTEFPAQWQSIHEPSDFGAQGLKKVLIPTE